MIVLQLCCIIHEYLDIVSIMHIINSRYITEITFHDCLHMFFKLYGIDEDSIIVCCMSMYCYFTRCSSEFERSSFKWIPSHFPLISAAQSLYLAEGNKCTLVAAIRSSNKGLMWYGGIARHAALRFLPVSSFPIYFTQSVRSVKQRFNHESRRRTENFKEFFSRRLL